MSRSPLAYPLTRGIDGDSGGAADLQTDIMRFMAILSLCLVAIFALVQSVPAVPEAVPLVESEPLTIEAADSTQPEAAPVIVEIVDRPPVARPEPPDRKTTVRSPAATRPSTKAASPAATKTAATKPTAEPVPAAAVDRGFTLRFASDLALTRLVARGDIAFYALDGERARRLTVRDSVLSFWDAKGPSAFHEMEVSTVPQAVIAAFERTGSRSDTLRWGVTLPGQLKTELDQLMRQHEGGALVIGADGALRREAS